MQARFIGDRTGHGPAILEAHGQSFPMGQWVEVSDTLGNFLSSNWHFEVRYDGTPKAAEAPKSNDWHDLDKTGLLDFAEKIGITLDRRKSLAKLQADFEAEIAARDLPDDEPEAEQGAPAEEEAE